MVSKHALQVSRPTPRGEVEGSDLRGFSRPTPRREVGVWPGVSPGPHPGGRGSPGPQMGGVSPGPHLGVSPGPHPGGSPGPHQGVSQHALRQTPHHMATAAGGTYPTGMNSC